LKRGKRYGNERMVGVEQEAKVTSGRRGEDGGGGEKEGRVRDFRELDRRCAEAQNNSVMWVTSLNYFELLRISYPAL
jgi:hypothetical protein